MIEKFVKDNRYLDSPANPKFPIFTIILNRPLNKNQFLEIYAYTSCLICADGGANRLYNIFTPTEREQYIPDVIIGDFDSILPEVRSYYESRGVRIVFNRSQSNTDLEKCIYYTFEISEPPPQGALGGEEGIRGSTRIIALGAFGGRMDQTLNSIHVLSKMYKSYPEKARENEILLMDEYSLITYLEPGLHEIIPSLKYQAKQRCGLLPIFSTEIQTKGLLYNLGPDYQYSKLEFGSFISTSNKIVEEKVIINCTDPVLWMTSLVPWQDEDDMDEGPMPSLPPLSPQLHAMQGETTDKSDI